MRGRSCRREQVVYNLEGKGARVVTGRNLDDDGSQSNASGKSSLVMAPLWALTGRSDARAEVSGASQRVIMQPCSRRILVQFGMPCTWRLDCHEDCWQNLKQTMCQHLRFCVAAEWLYLDVNPLKYKVLTHHPVMTHRAQK